jgi:hypothetical protein
VVEAAAPGQTNVALHALQAVGALLPVCALKKPGAHGIGAEPEPGHQ